MRIAFMGTPDFAVPTLDALIAAGHEVVAVYTQPPRPAGRGKALSPLPRPAPRRGAGIEVRTPVIAARRRRAGGVRGARPRCRGGRRLWADPARADPRRAALRLPQRPRLAAAALARRGADPAGDPRRRQAHRRHHHADGARPRHRADARRRAGRDRPQDRRRAHRRAGRDRRGVDGPGAARLYRAGRMPQPEARATYAPKIEKHEARLDFSRSRRRRSSGRSARSIRRRAPFSSIEGERIKILAAEISELSGEPGHRARRRPAIACGDGAIVPTLVQRAGRARDAPGRAAARLRHPGRRS